MRFNGATRIHAWRRNGRRRKACRMRCFNGATRIHAWRRGAGGCRPELLPGFNGATRIHAWRQWAGMEQAKQRPRLQWGHAHSRVETPLGRFETAPAGLASMGPRAFTRGDRSRGILRGSDYPASMGPRAFTRGDAGQPLRGYRLRAASMGPRAFTRGDERVAVHPEQPGHALQWGHAHSRVETRGTD